MTVQTILQYPDPRLRETAKRVVDFDENLARLADDLVETLYATTGIGLCATQIGDRRALLVMDLSEDHSDPQVYINPQVTAADVPAYVEESCLSVPDMVGTVVRNSELDVTAQDVNGETFQRHLSGMEAICLQHEMDHLNGTLFVDRLSWFRRMMFRAKAGREARRAA
ncbi:MAG: peptide deformylase [Pseudomonadota bacterium]